MHKQNFKVELLYVTEFERHPKPLQAAREFSEALLANERPPAEGLQERSLLLSESMQAFCDNVVSNLRTRGHQD